MKKSVKQRKLSFDRIVIASLSGSQSDKIVGGETVGCPTNTSGASFIDECLTEKPQTWEKVCQPQ